jgi:sulfur carrier protein
VEIMVNDEPRDVAEGTTVAQLLSQLDLQPKYLAVERNLLLVPRGEHAACVLQPADRLEIVTLVGGG